MAGRVLVVANETIGGKALQEAVLKRATDDTEFFLVVPQTKPRHGNVIYDEAVRDAAQVRVDLASQFMKQRGLDIAGEVGDDDPFNATLDAVDEWRPTEIIVSTHPETSSGWLRRDLIDRIERGTGLPVEHVVSDIKAEGLPHDITLVVANRTAETPELLDLLKQRAKESHKNDRPRMFIVVVPQDHGDGLAARAARRRLANLLARLRSEGLACAGFIGDPDPFTATMNALQAFTVHDVVISTFGESRSGWLRGDLIGRVKARTPLTVEHIQSTLDAAAA